MHCFSCNIHFAEGSKACSVCGSHLDTDSDRYFKAGMEALAEGNIDRSVMLLEDCVGLNASHVSGRYNLGIALSLADRCTEAMEHYATIVDEHPDYPGIYTAMGQAAFGSYLLHLSEAEAQCNAMLDFLMTAIEQDSNDVDAYFSLANAYIALENPEEALQWIEKALHIHPDSPAINFTMAKILKMLGKSDEASKAAEKSVQLSGPGDPFWEEIKGFSAELRGAA